MSRSFAEALRWLDMCATGNNWRTLKRYALEVWLIPVDHFDPHAASRDALLRGRRVAKPLAEVLVYAEGLKQAVGEMCDQGELWRGRRLALILDHVNGVNDDHRLENLRILCPNCAATLDTHCGRNVRHTRECATCGADFRPAGSKQRHCSHSCSARSEASRAAHEERRQVERPPHAELVAQVAELGWSAIGRKYGVSDYAVRKWVRAYELAAAAA